MYLPILYETTDLMQNLKSYAALLHHITEQDKPALMHFIQGWKMKSMYKCQELQFIKGHMRNKKGPACNNNKNNRRRKKEANFPVCDNCITEKPKAGMLFQTMWKTISLLTAFMEDTLGKSNNYMCKLFDPPWNWKILSKFLSIFSNRERYFSCFFLLIFT